MASYAKMLGPIVPQMLGPELPANDREQVIASLRGKVVASDQGALVALIGLNQLMSAQTANIQITYRTYYSRIHVRAANPNPVTGLVEKPTFQFFSSGSAGAGQNAGFNRQLDQDDTNVTTASFLAANRAFIGLNLGFRTNTNMPLPILDVLANRSIVYQQRGNVNYSWGRMLDWPVGELGPASQAAATTVPTTQITFTTNGLGSMCALPSDGRVYFAPKQEIQIGMRCFGSFFATTNGLPLGPNNSLIPNSGEEGESAGYVECVLRGYEIVQPG